MRNKPDPSAAIEAAYESYADAIFRHCYFRIFDRERGRELMQETFLRTWGYLSNGGTIDNMRAFLYRVANNLIIDDVRKKKELSLDALNEQGFDPPGDDESSVVQRLKDQQILQILKKLPAESRELIIMRHIDGLKPQDISDLLGLAPNTVSVRIHRAMKDLKAILKPQSQ